MAAAPGLKIYSAEGEYVAACHYPEDAACIVALRGDGASIRAEHSKKSILWLEGAEGQPAAESYDHVAAVCAERLAALIAKSMGGAS